MNRFVIGATLVGLVLVGCGSSGGGHEGHTMPAGDGAAAVEGTVPGELAEASESSKSVRINTLDELRFDPASIEVSAGEVVTFVVTNPGSTDHEFVLGDQEYQEAHGGDMEHDMSTGNAVAVAPGETKEITWRFTEAGEVLFGCHEAGHYDGGMVGEITVTS